MFLSSDFGGEIFRIIRGKHMGKLNIRWLLTSGRYWLIPVAVSIALLPVDHIASANPVIVLGVDFTGPLYTCNVKPRKIFIGLYISAVVEVVSDLFFLGYLYIFHRSLVPVVLQKVLNSLNAPILEKVTINFKCVWEAIRHHNVRDIFCWQPDYMNVYS